MKRCLILIFICLICLVVPTSVTAQNDIELDSLQRDYENIQARYNAAINNLNQAQMSERIETTAQGQRISVIENANVPRVPSGCKANSSGFVS